MQIAGPIADVIPLAWVFFIVFVVVVALGLLNLLTGELGACEPYTCVSVLHHSSSCMFGIVHTALYILNQTDVHEVSIRCFPRVTDGNHLGA